MTEDDAWMDAMTRVWPNVMTFAETLVREKWRHRLCRATLCRALGCKAQPFIDRTTKQPMLQDGYCPDVTLAVPRHQG